MKLTLIAAIALTATAAQAQESGRRFDLICKGEMAHTIDDKLSIKPFTARYIIDLDAKEWCANKCASLGRVEEGPDVLTFHTGTQGSDDDYRPSNGRT